jgi:hypothetical protein
MCDMEVDIEDCGGSGEGLEDLAGGNLVTLTRERMQMKCEQENRRTCAGLPDAGVIVIIVKMQSKRERQTIEICIILTLHRHLRARESSSHFAAVF